MRKGVLIGITAGMIGFGLIFGIVLALVLGNRNKNPKGDQVASAQAAASATELEGVETMARTSFIDSSNDISVPAYTPSVAPYSTDASLSNLYNTRFLNAYYSFDFDSEKRQMLAQQNFVVTKGNCEEFFGVYEGNRYGLIPSFVTVDSMMHTYHLYYAMLQKTTELDYLYNKLDMMSKSLLEESKNQYNALRGTEWEEAAARNVAFFNIGAALTDESVGVESDVAGVVNQELDNIRSAAGITDSPLLGTQEDYSQYVVRGYYDTDPKLQKYFKAMMWYGRVNYQQDVDSLNRSALLMTLALNKAGTEQWDAIYSVTSFFAGNSDDSGYYEYYPVIKAAYGDGVTVDQLVGNDKAYEEYTRMTAALDPPQINSVVFGDDDGATDKAKVAKGFRFMGQRFTFDAAVFHQLVYSNVKKTENDEMRLLPDALDVPAALGSEMAYNLMAQQGETNYPNYDEQLNKAKSIIENQPNIWNGSLYARWLYTLSPLLVVKGDGYPSFMTNDAWTKKSLEAYLGSWTELKHDSILYAKQEMAEMGGGDDEEWEVPDDKGYVEPEPELYCRLANLSRATATGLKKFDILSPANEQELLNFAQLAENFMNISVKELQNENLTEAEYDLIRNYGGDLEHMWDIAMQAETGEEYNSTEEHPASLVADVATDPNGSCLEVANGNADIIWVIVPVDGQIRFARGVVYNFYQFSYPLSDRLTDVKWRDMLVGHWDDSYSTYTEPVVTDDWKPSWTREYRVEGSYEYWY